MGGTGKEEEDHVIALTTSTFKDHTSKGRILVEFYAPWCGHCKAIEPEYKKAASTLKKKKLKTKLGKVDATVEASLASEFGVQGYPTLMYFVDGEKFEYDGGRTEDTIVSWLEGKEVDPVKKCTTKEVEKLIERAAAGEASAPEYVIEAVAVRKSGKHVALKKAMQAIAGELKTSSNSVVQACLVYAPKGSDAKTFPATLKLHRPRRILQEGVAEFPAGKAWSADGVKSWLNKEITSGVGIYSPLVFGGTFFKGKFVIAAAGAGSDELPDRKGWAELLRDVAKALPKKEASGGSFTLWDGKEYPRNDLGGQSGTTMAPVLLLLSQDGDRYAWKFPKDADSKTAPKGSVKDIAKWISAVLAGSDKIKPDYKSQPVPEKGQEDDIDGVRVLVGYNFEEVVNDPKTDVFVEFYAPWCGHCKKLAPEWSKLAARIKKMNKKNVVIAKFDGTANDCAVKPEGFPTLKLFPAVKNSIKKAIDYSSGDRTEGVLFDFLSENAVNLEGVEESMKDKAGKKKGYSMVERELEKKKATAKGKKEEL